ncbi:MAG: helix-turn-helix transcriptional regulator [Butyrivibrio sp.]|nr:helix-turn-helix transcriptional regulator [Butyrivibrio sp.]
MIEFGEQLRSAREIKGLTQKMLADQLYVSRQTISNWERGERYPDIVTLKKISQLLEVSLDNLLSGKEMVKVVEKKSVIENKIVNGMIAVLYAFIVLSLFFNVCEHVTLYFINAYARFGNGYSLLEYIFQPVDDYGVYYVNDRDFFGEQVCLLIIFSYGLYNAIRDNLTPKKIGTILIAFFSSFMFFHVVLHAIANRGYSSFYKECGLLVYMEVISREMIIPVIFCIMGIIASYFYFVREGKRKLWLNMIMVVSALGIISKFIDIFNRLKHEKFYIINYSTATFHESQMYVRDIAEGAVITVGLYVLAAYQARVLERKRKLAMELSEEKAENTGAC